MATLQFNLTVDNDQKTAILTDFTSHHKYPVLVPDPADPASGLLVPNPQSRAAYAKQMIIDFIRDSIKAERSNIKANEAIATEVATVDAISIT